MFGTLIDAAVSSSSSKIYLTRGGLFINAALIIAMLDVCFPSNDEDDVCVCAHFCVDFTDDTATG